MHKHASEHEQCSCKLGRSLRGNPSVEVEEEAGEEEG